MGISFFAKKVTGDDFSNGIDNWTAIVTDADATMDWYQNNSLRTSINTGDVSEYDNIRAVWDYPVSGDFDIQVGYQRLTEGPIGGARTNSFGLMLSPLGDNGSLNNIFIIALAHQATMRSAYALGGVVQDTVNNTSKPDLTLPSLRLRITRSGSTFTTYQDPSTGSWIQAAQFNISSFANERMVPIFFCSRNSDTFVSAKFDNLVIDY